MPVQDIEEIGIPLATLRMMYQLMLKIRRFEEKIVELYPAQDMRTPVHLYIGQEAVATGVCLNLRKDDYIFSNHRGHGHCIAKGMGLKPMMAEFYGRKTGCCKGKGGSMHIADPENGIMGTSAIVGGGLPLAVGTALASVMQKNKRISVAFFGDGGVDEGSFHESLNFASLKKLPALFVCENNFYATNSHQAVRQASDDIARLAEGYMIPGVCIDGNDVIAIFKTAQKAIERARSGKGPTLIECRTYRWKGHVGPDCDVEKGCRPREELDQWVKRCPIKRFKELLLNENLVSEAEMSQIAKEVEKEIEEAVAFAKNSPFPEEKELLEDVY